MTIKLFLYIKIAIAAEPILYTDTLSLSLSTIDELTNDLAQDLVKKSESIIISTTAITSPAIETLLKATDKDNMTIITFATPLFCSTHIENNFYHSNIWKYSECDTATPP